MSPIATNTKPLHDIDRTMQLKEVQGDATANALARSLITSGVLGARTAKASSTVVATTSTLVEAIEAVIPGFGQEVYRLMAEEEQLQSPVRASLQVEAGTPPSPSSVSIPPSIVTPPSPDPSLRSAYKRLSDAKREQAEMYSNVGF